MYIEVYYSRTSLQQNEKNLRTKKYPVLQLSRNWLKNHYSTIPLLKQPLMAL